MLQERRIILKEAAVGKGPLIYWMSRDQRANDNWALICAQELALRGKAPLIVVFCLVPRFLNATSGRYAFMLAGLEELSQRLAKLNISFFLLTGEPDKILTRFIKTHMASTLITDFDPLRTKKQWKEEMARKIEIPFYEVDAHNIVPCTFASLKREYGAYTIRNKISNSLPFFLDTFPKLQKHPFPLTKDLPRIEWEKLSASLKINNSIGNFDWITPGEAEAQKRLTHLSKKSSPSTTREGMTPQKKCNRTSRPIFISVNSRPSGWLLRLKKAISSVL
jgi:deoxyribodipyrimidine photo-lyase